MEFTEMYIDANGSKVNISETEGEIKDTTDCPIKIMVTNNSGANLYFAYTLYACDYNIIEMEAYKN